MKTVAPTLAEVLGFCRRSAVERVFLEDAALRGLGRFSAVRDGRGLRALCHVGINVVPSGEGCAAFAPEVGAAASRVRMIIGEESAVSDLWEQARGLLPAPKDDRPGQPVYVIHEPPPPGHTGLRPAASHDFPLVLPACAAAHREELGADPLATADADAFRRRTRLQIEERRSWLWTEGGRILFKAEASAWTRDAVQIQQVWVDPEVRNRGYARRGMRDLCRLLLRQTPAVCLFVRPENAPALRVYEAIGMRRSLDYRSLLF